MIERWAHAGPTHLHARFQATGVAGAFCDRIVLSIKADQHPELGTLDEHDLVSFDPVTGKIVDKRAGELITRSIDRRIDV